MTSKTNLIKKENYEMLRAQEALPGILGNRATPKEGERVLSYSLWRKLYALAHIGL